jgi:cytochrome c5
MKMKKLLLALLLVPVAAIADESTVKLKPGPNVEVVNRNCSICHSLDYIQMNSVFLDRKAWEAEVNKMIKVMGAPIKPDDTPKIVDYLASHYGK